jgi:divalent metal cation (Fe/Co/Zn/Cd) transporter
MGISLQASGRLPLAWERQPCAKKTRSPKRHYGKPFGHGKGEAVAAFTQATFLAGAAFVLVVQSIQRLVHTQRINALDVGLSVIVASLVTALALVILQTWVLRKTGSTAIAADRAHYLTWPTSSCS